MKNVETVWWEDGYSVETSRESSAQYQSSLLGQKEVYYLRKKENLGKEIEDIGGEEVQPICGPKGHF